MVTTPKTSNSQAKSKPTLEIIPDTRFIVFAGDQYEASSTKLTGRVRLNCPEATSICKPKLRLEGKRKIGWINYGGMSSGVVEDRTAFYHQERRLGSIESTHKVNAGPIEWPFEFELDPSLPESVEGLRDTFIVYDLHASVSRPGWNSKDITARAHIRIIRTLGNDSLGTTRSRVNADIWANKLSYSISIPTDAIIFGTSITADVELSPIRKGVRLGRVEMQLIETVVKRIMTSDTPDTRSDKTKSDEVEVAKTKMDFPEGTKVTYEQESPENPVVADEMYRFKATLPLPRSLNNCRQDVDSHLINITHRFKLMVNIHNPEGHVSQLVCRLPVKLFLSPNMPIDDSNEVRGTSDQRVNATTTIVAPPQYGLHQLDQMYSDIDPSGYISRAGSGPNTPAGIAAQSRRGSDENLRSLNGIADIDIMAEHGSATPSILRSRLANLRDWDDAAGLAIPTNSADHSTPASDASSPAYVPRSSSAPDVHQLPNASQRNSAYFPPFTAYVVSTSAPDDGRGLPESNTTEGQNVHFALHDLSRVPSYNAALRAPGPITPFNEGPPSYIEATSRPPSPQRLAETQRRSGQNSPPGPPLPSPPTRTHLGLTYRSGLSDDEARLRALQAEA